MTEPDVAPQPLGELGRISNVFVNPKKAFADIVARPKWYVPVILIVLASTVMVYFYSQRVGFERAVEKALDESPRAQSMTAEQRDQALKMGAKVGPVMGYVAPVIYVPVMVLVTAAVLMLLVNSLFGSKVRFDQMAAITAYSMLTQLVVTALAILILFLKSPDDFDIRNPVGFNIGAYLGDATPKWLMSLATSIDLFSFWTIALLATGIVVATRKPSWGKAVFAVVAPWCLIVLVKAGWTALFS